MSGGRYTAHDVFCSCTCVCSPRCNLKLTAPSPLQHLYVYTVILGCLLNTPKMGCCSSSEMEDGITVGTEDYDKSRRYSAVSAASKGLSRATSQGTWRRIQPGQGRQALRALPVAFHDTPTAPVLVDTNHTHLCTSAACVFFVPCYASSPSVWSALPVDSAPSFKRTCVQ